MIAAEPNFCVGRAGLKIDSVSRVEQLRQSLSFSLVEQVKDRLCWQVRLNDCGRGYISGCSSGK